MKYYLYDYPKTLLWIFQEISNLDEEYGVENRMILIKDLGGSRLSSRK